MRINKLQVPKVIRHGAPVVLDCDFTIDETDQGLVVKWFFNKSKNLVYQWIPGNLPSTLTQKRLGSNILIVLKPS